MSHHAMSEGHTCSCDDPDVERLRELIAAGYTQREASLFLWDTPDPCSTIALDHARIQTVTFVRAAFARAFPWLRLPTPGTEVR